jgi:hypothetical protein
MSCDPSEPRDETGKWTNLLDIPDPTRQEGTIRVALPGGGAGEVRGYTPEVNYGAFKEPAHFQVLPDGKSPGHEVHVSDAKIIEHRK